MPGVRNILWGFLLALYLHLCSAATLRLDIAPENQGNDSLGEVQGNDLPGLSIYVEGKLFGGFLRIGSWNHD